MALAFLVTTILFVIYERLVTRRERTKNAALRVISTMFPSAVQERVLKGAADGRGGGGSLDQDNLIASFYPATTVLFGGYHVLWRLQTFTIGLNSQPLSSCSSADIEGFTAWRYALGSCVLFGA